ncbi:short-chain dehydrogenase [Neoasaia chiangmaiensis NBRC 101099]|uniref:Short-chain dehydrogenase/reductase n=1 Tax=Neoasaia chiangmaiensis TaxID=320497 RepID=A0A1U9KQ24_9PROT|nr:oxidoreductase [Neoasaia chiangmaiensis]AQS87885.1 short-chain dehydrogenase/reductase [Neoasaia chiangmaiensis]GBR39181.1 short-chain dehydrogenase [Neoasaia chiangmaiensis NBRC 101099]GEN15532.1 short-chain dehydrogenase/reductase [Neoasaia chiangmaiensis]
MSASDNVWFITGCSTGFGRDLAGLVLERGERAVITARNLAAIGDFAEKYGERALVLPLDVTNDGQITAAVTAARKRFGRIDVLVNNAGYGYQSSVEEGVESEIRAMFDANVFGLFALTRAVLPVMRAQKSGRILNITSIAGLIGFPSSGYYAATKHAVEGWSDALAEETAPLGIKVTCVEPGPFRTDWAGRSLKQTPNEIEDYRETAGARLAATAGNSGKQAGDPLRAAQAMIDIAHSDAPPRHFVLGRWGFDAVVDRLGKRLDEIRAWEKPGVETDFPAEAAS